jgi:FkbM family methyltransferase
VSLTPDQLSEVANLLAQLANWQHRTFTRPEPYGSQDGEDAIIAELCPEPNGVYVDVGAGDPVSCSNTFQLWRRGWRGLLIEPRKDAVYDLCARRAGDCVYPVAASNEDGWNRLRLQGSVSSMQSDWNIDEQTKSFCKIETLRTILAKFPAIRDACQLCSIDVEGHERQVLEGIDWETFRPRVFVVEYVVYGVQAPQSDISGQWESLLTAQGYRLYGTTSLNKIYVRA